MPTLSNLQQAKAYLVETLKTNYPNIHVMSTDVKDGVVRPSFFIDFRDSKTIETYTTWATHYSIPVDLVYFPSEMVENEVEILGMEDSLHLNFLTKVKGMNVFNKRTMTVDDVLHFNFDLDFVAQLPDTDNSPLIEHLEMDLEVDGNISEIDL